MGNLNFNLDTHTHTSKLAGKARASPFTRARRNGRHNSCSVLHFPRSDTNTRVQR